MRKLRATLLVAIAACLIGMVTPAFAQDVGLSGFNRDQIVSAALSCYIQAAPANGSFENIMVTIADDPAVLYECAGLVDYSKTTYSGFQVADYSWMMSLVTYNALGGTANVRNAPDANAPQLGTVNPTTSPVIEVDAVFKVSDDETRVLIRSKQISGWVNNADAKIDLSAVLEKPVDWSLDIMPDSLNNVAGGEPADWSYPTLYGPNGDPFTDVLRTNTDLVGHGRLLHGSDAHFVFAIRENGQYNQRVVYNGYFLRVEGDIWRYFPNWKMAPASGAPMPGIDKAPIVNEFFIKDAYEHSLIQFVPSGYVYPASDGKFRFFQQNEILAWPQAQAVLNQAVCPSQPVRLNVAGNYDGDIQNYDAAVGNHACISYFIGTTSNTPDGSFEIMVLTPGTQAQEFSYLRDHAAFFMVPPELSAEGTKAWLSANLKEILTSVGLSDRQTANMTGVVGFADGSVPTADLLAAQ